MRTLKPGDRVRHRALGIEGIVTRFRTWKKKPEEGLRMDVAWSDGSETRGLRDGRSLELLEVAHYAAPDVAMAPVGRDRIAALVTAIDFIERNQHPDAEDWIDAKHIAPLRGLLADARRLSTVDPNK